MSKSLSAKITILIFATLVIATSIVAIALLREPAEPLSTTEPSTSQAVTSQALPTPTLTTAPTLQPTAPTVSETVSMVVTQAPLTSQVQTAPTTAYETTALQEQTAVTTQLRQDILYGENISPLVEPTIISVSADEALWKMTLVNKNYRLPEGFEVKTVPSIEGSDIPLDYRVAPFYQAMYNAAAQEGIYLTPYSGYRRYSTQKRNYENKTAYYESLGYSHDEALAKAATIIMPPGSSEHNLGLAMDICGTDNNFDTTKEFAWLMQHAHEYGFILRYTREKQIITQVIYEPWHWRYVGVENAKKIKDSGLCLEEYIEQFYSQG